MAELKLYQVSESIDVVLHASDPEDAHYCANEAWEKEDFTEVREVSNPEEYADLRIGLVRKI